MSTARPILDLVIAMKEVKFDLEAVVNVFSRDCGDLMFFALDSKPERYCRTQFQNSNYSIAKLLCMQTN